MSRPPFSFEESVYRELDQIRQACERQAAAFERAVERLEKRDDERDAEVSELKLKVTELRLGIGPAPRDWKRDAGLVIAPSTIVAIIGALAQHFTQPEPPPAPRPTAPYTAPAQSTPTPVVVP